MCCIWLVRLSVMGRKKLICVLSFYNFRIINNKRNLKWDWWNDFNCVEFISGLSN